MKKTILALALLIPALAFSQGAPLPVGDPLPSPTNGTANVLLAWDASPDEDIVAAYELGWFTEEPAIETTTITHSDGTITTNFLSFPQPPNSFYITNGLYGLCKGLETNVTHFFVVRAVGKNGYASEWSSVVSYTVPAVAPRPTRPKGPNVIQVPVYELTVFFSDDPEMWEQGKTIQLVIDSDRPRQFFKVETEVKLNDAIRIE